jgi:hypothetical protein
MTALWREKIPVEAAAQYSVFEIALIAYKVATELKPPIPSTKAEVADYLENHHLVTRTPDLVASLARSLHQDLLETPSYARVRWADLWPGDPTITFDRLLSAVAATVSFYEILSGVNSNANSDCQSRPGGVELGRLSVPTLG